MKKRSYNTLFFICCLMLLGCAKKQVELKGWWVIDRMYNENGEIFVRSQTSKIIMQSIGYEDKHTVEFVSNYTIHVPGIYSRDVPFKWDIIRDSLILTADTNLILKEYSLDTLPVFDANKRRMLRRANYLKLRQVDTLKHLFNTIDFYQGKYSITSFEDGLDLVSKNKGIKLLNMDILTKRRLDEIMPR
ncbi:hypothetical protein [Pedobacter sp. ASV28]|uniref:hypothetical protein n=1 Tax=Pedobacter sp. ASV28 TaxID=2795123 RepID=UPI0018EA6513|nr:hypothetical protein [Pedobacter sp. ASV28]